MAGPKMHPDTLRAMDLHAKGLTIIAAATKMGIHRTTLSRALTNKKKRKRLRNGVA